MSTVTDRPSDVTSSITGPAPSGGTGASRTLRRLAFWVAMVILTVVFVAPLLWMLITSFKDPSAAITSNAYSWVPNPFTSTSYKTLVNNPSFPVFRWFLNSLLAGAGNTLLILIVDSMAAYALARLDFPGKKFIFGTIVGTIFIPAFVFIIPNFLIVSQLGWLDSLWAIIVPSAGGAFGVFFLRQFFSTLPKELEEAAVIDGANQWTVFTRVILPLARPALATLAVLSFLTNWNDFLWPIYVLFTAPNLTLPAGLENLQSAATTNYPLIMAGAVIAAVPVLILFVIAQRHIIEGVARSGLKG